MPSIKLKPIRRPRMTLRDERSQAYRAAEKICGVIPHTPRTFHKKK